MLNYVDTLQFKKGWHAALPICIGYFAVSFTLGITARNAGLTWFEAALMSLLNNTSAGQAAGIAIIGNDGSYTEIILSQVIINLRYMLMSAALAQKLKPGTGICKRLGMSFEISDEIFGISILQDGFLNAYFTIGAIVCACPGWVAGTALGVVVGNILPANVISALSLALYAMFIAVIVPPARHSLLLLILIIISMLSSLIFDLIPFLSSISYGTKIIILTLVISALAALVFPVKEEVSHEA